MPIISQFIVPRLEQHIQRHKALAIKKQRLPFLSSCGMMANEDFEHLSQFNIHQEDLSDIDESDQEQEDQKT